MSRFRFQLLIIVVVAASFTVGCLRNKRAQLTRDRSYQESLKSYSEKFPSGTTRKNVENYLRAKGVQFQQEKLDGGNALTDLVHVGDDPPPSFCSRYAVFVALDFNATEPHAVFSAYDSDTLAAIRLHRRGEGCI